MKKEPRPFRAPWKVRATDGGHFTVVDADGFVICYLYCSKQPTVGNDYLTMAEAVTLAEAIAEVPRLHQRNEPQA